MKKCPTCQSTFDDNLRFCQNDGAILENYDPYQTMVASPPASTPAEDEPLQIPDFDPNKTSVFSADEQADVLSTPPSAPSFGDLGSLPAPEMPDSFSQPQSQPIPPPPEPPSFGAPSYAEPEQIYNPQPSPFDSPFAAPTQQMGGQPDWNPPPAPVPQWQGQGNFGANTPFQPPGAAIGGQNTTLATVALICGILGLCCGPLGIAALIVGFIAKGKADNEPNEYGGRGLALAGMILGGISIALMILGILLQMLGALANIGR